MYSRRMYQMKEKERRGASGTNCNVILEPLLGTQDTFGLVTRECPELPKFFFALLCDVLKMCAAESRVHVPTCAMEGLSWN
jgi:hypothetical protein